MPMLMSDMAAGSSAVRTMQQNVMGAQNDQLAEDARKADLQAKISQDSLNTQQKELDVNRTRLANIVTQTGIDLDNSSRAAIEQVRSTPEYKSATEGDQARMIASAIEGSKPMDASKLREQAAVTDLKDMQTRIQKGNEADDQLAKAFGTIADASPEQIKQIIGSWDDKQKAAVKALIPNYQEEDTDLLKKQLSRVMLNARGQNTAMMMAEREKIQKMIDDSREKISQDRLFERLSARTRGEDDRDARADKKAVQQITSAIETDERLSSKEINKLSTATKQAAIEYRASGWFGTGMGPGVGKARETWQAASDAEMDARKQLSERNIERILSMPDSPDKNRRLKQEEDHLKLFDEPPPDPKETKDEDKKKSGKITNENTSDSKDPLSTLSPTQQVQAVKDMEARGQDPKTMKANGVPVTSKTPEVTKTQEDFDTKWKTLKSGQSLVGPDGKTYTKK